MTGHVAAVLVANVLMLGAGAGLLPLLGLARSRRELGARLGLAYMVGVVAVGALSANLALLTGALGLDLGFGAIGLFVFAVASLALGLRRLPAGARGPRPDAAALVGLLALVPAAAIVVAAVRAYAVKPLLEYDGWVIWATKARALDEFGRVYAPVFAGDAYRSIHLDYPLLFPSLEAVDLRTMGAFDGAALHVQLALLLGGFVAALWALARPVAWPPLLGVVALALAASPELLYQLSTNYADLPLAFFVALGVVALAVWLERGERGFLVAAVVFLGGACLTKNEGTVFALAAFAAAAALAGRARLRPLAVAAAATFALELPWRVWVAAHGIHSEDFRLTNALDPGYLRRTSDRLGPSAHDLWQQLRDTHHWGYLVPLAAVALVVALASRRLALAGFAALWFSLSFAGLLVVYWIAQMSLDENLFNTANRTVASLVVGSAALAPMLVGRPSR
jgi:hypothetical protein